MSIFETRLIDALKLGVSMSRRMDSNVFQKSLKVVCSAYPQDLPLEFSDVKRLVRRGIYVAQQDMIAESCAAWPVRSRFNRLFRRESRPRIGMLVPDGQSARTFLLSDVYRKLNKWAEVIVLSPFDELWTLDGNLPPEKLYRIPSPKRQPLETLLRYSGYRVSNSPTHKIYQNNLDESYARALQQGKLDKNLQIWNLSERFSTIESYQSLYAFVMYIYGATTPLGQARKELSRLKLSLLLNTNCISWISKIWTRAAAIESLPVVSNVVSWDNVSTKWLIDEFAAQYLVWSQEMDQDFDMSLPHFRNKQRRIVGSPQFEAITQKRGLVPKEEFFRHFGLDVNKPLILYTTGSKTTFPAEPQFLNDFLAHWKEHYSDRFQCMVRMHPKDRSERYDELRSKYNNVAFTYAGKSLQNDNQWVPSPNDIDLLVNQLHHSDVIVNVASTMTLEGFAAGKPSVNIGFDLGLINSLHYPLRDYYKSRHYRDLVDMDAVYLANNYEEFYAMLEKALAHPDEKRHNQKHVLKMKCDDVTASSDRINASIADFVAHRLGEGRL
ncbi:hypothetical protein QVG61_06395 [Thiohalobacter sp. IOR34]|uniref:hypothetical protein n=1 Tax=Thiohalobacter sp. IOR34 TaxID=3057176 RepID=UPI0025B20FCE|nr:hypothetical protein [Thiohalobacter sp. IOR34]WJW76711.1 hypothetical protein QVG61_06395 [Thiohalobacter sp. IOR34]